MLQRFYRQSGYAVIIMLTHKIINIQALIIKNTRLTCNGDRTLLNCLCDKFLKHKFKFYYLRAYRRSRYCDHRVHVGLWICLSNCRLTHERVHGCRPNLVRGGWGDHLDVVTFWCWLDSGSGSRTTFPLSLTLRDRAFHACPQDI